MCQSRTASGAWSQPHAWSGCRYRTSLSHLQKKTRDLEEIVSNRLSPSYVLHCLGSTGLQNSRPRSDTHQNSPIHGGYPRRQPHPVPLSYDQRLNTKIGSRHLQHHRRCRLRLSRLPYLHLALEVASARSSSSHTFNFPSFWRVLHRLSFLVLPSSSVQYASLSCFRRDGSPEYDMSGRRGLLRLLRRESFRWVLPQRSLHNGYASIPSGKVHTNAN